MSAVKEYFDADYAGYAEIEYWTSAESAKSASEILNQTEWCAECPLYLYKTGCHLSAEGGEVLLL